MKRQWTVSNEFGDAAQAAAYDHCLDIIAAGVLKSIMADKKKEGERNGNGCRDNSIAQQNAPGAVEGSEAGGAE